MGRSATRRGPQAQVARCRDSQVRRRADGRKRRGTDCLTHVVLEVSLVLRALDTKKNRIFMWVRPNSKAQCMLT